MREIGYKQIAIKCQNEIKQWIAEGRPKSDIVKFLGCDRKILDRALSLLKIEYKGNQGAKGYKRSPYKKSATEFLRRGTSRLITSHKLKTRLLEEGLREYRCQRCGRRKWLGEAIPLDLHHRDGDTDNNEASNIELLCPNCHRLTENWGTRNGR